MGTPTNFTFPGCYGTCFCCYIPTPTTVCSGNVPWAVETNGFQDSKASANFFNRAFIRNDGTLWVVGANYSGGLGTGNVINACCFTQTVSGGTNWSQVVVAGSSSSMFGLKTDGTLWGWGTNLCGMLGNGDTLSRSSPTQTISGGTNWRQVDNASFTVGAVKTDGTLWVWGRDLSGVLGIGLCGAYGEGASVVMRCSPVQTIAGGSNWKQVSVASSGMAATKTDGTLWAWGDAACGRLGTGNYVAIDGTCKSSPVQTISGGTNWRCDNLLNNDFSDFSTGWSTSGNSRLAIKTDGTLWAWGAGYNYVLGLGTSNAINSPTQVGTANNWRKVATTSSSHTLATKTDGTLWAWGFQSAGRLGNGISNYSSITTPIQIGTDTNWNIIAVGSGISGGIKTDGTLWTWGDQGRYALGQPDKNSRSSPVQVGTANNWCRLSFNSESTNGNAAAIKTDGTLWTWGQGLNGSTGQGNTLTTSTPIQVGTGTNWCQIRAGRFTSVGIRTDNTLWAWGQTAALCEAGLPAFTCTPVQVGTGADWRQVNLTNSGYQAGILAVKTNGTLWAASYELDYARPDPSGSLAGCLLQLGSDTNWCHVKDRMGVKSNGTLWVWGSNGGGALGLGVTGNTLLLCSRSSPVQVGTASDWKQVTTTNFVTMGIKCNNTLWATGRISYAGAGCGAGLNVSTPIQIGTDTNWRSVISSKGTSVFMGLKTDGTIWGWGLNDQTFSPILLNGFPSTVCSPVQVASTRTWCQIGSITDSSIGIDSSNNLVVWGRNVCSNGGIGIDSNVRFECLRPIDLDDVFTRREFFEQGNLWGWGVGGYTGILANGIANGTNYSSPVQVAGGGNNWRTVSISQGAFKCSGAGTKIDGTLWTWGDGTDGQLGTGSAFICRSSPVQVGANTNWKAVSSGGSHMAAIKTDGTLWTWGYGNNGRLGDGGTSNRTSPIQIATSTSFNWIDVQAIPNLGGIGLRSDNTLWSWGLNPYGNLGKGNTTAYNTPTQITSPSSTPWVRIAQLGPNNPGAGGAWVFNTGNLCCTLWVWGRNNCGKLGLGDVIDRCLPVALGSCLDGWKTGMIGDSSSAFIRNNGSLWVIGNNNNGQLGTNNLVNYSSPVQTIAGSLDWKNVAVGTGNILAVKTNGTLWGMGEINLGANQPFVCRSSPVQLLSGSTGWVCASTSGFAFMALKSSL